MITSFSMPGALVTVENGFSPALFILPAIDPVKRLIAEASSLLLLLKNGFVSVFCYDQSEYCLLPRRGMMPKVLKLSANKENFQ